MVVTNNLANYVQNLGINLSELARQTGIPYMSIYRSIGVANPQRELRADELTNICLYLHVDPLKFAEKD